VTGTRAVTARVRADGRAHLRLVVLVPASPTAAGLDGPADLRPLGVAVRHVTAGPPPGSGQMARCTPSQ
jgi:hypothetical protein